MTKEEATAAAFTALADEIKSGTRMLWRKVGNNEWELDPEITERVRRRLEERGFQ